MRTITDLAQPDSVAETLAVLLPGAYNTPEDFLREGFVTAVRERGLGVDIVLADMNLECITSGTALSQLRETVICPARHTGHKYNSHKYTGYKHIWLIGISIGGFMASLYADSYPGEINGVCLIAPYPGSRMITEQISASGGYLQWSADAIDADDHEARVWHWLKHHARQDIDIYLGYGNEDRFTAAHAEMSAVVAPEQVCVVSGGHDWPTWKKIWLQFLDQSAFAHYHNTD